MASLSKYEGKDRRRQRLRNRIVRDLASPKWRQPERKRTDNEDGSYYFTDVYHDDEGDE